RGDEAVASRVERGVERGDRRFARLDEQFLDARDESIEEVFLAVALVVRDLAHALERVAAQCAPARADALAAQVRADRSPRAVLASIAPGGSGRWPHSGAPLVVPRCDRGSPRGVPPQSACIFARFATRPRRSRSALMKAR